MSTALKMPDVMPLPSGAVVHSMCGEPTRLDLLECRSDDEAICDLARLGWSAELGCDAYDDRGRWTGVHLRRVETVGDEEPVAA